MKLNRKRLVIVLEDQIYLYDIQTMKLLSTIDTSPNPNGRLHINQKSLFSTNKTSHLCSGTVIG